MLALRNIRGRKIFSSINIIGFAFSITVCMAIFLFLVKEYSYDSDYANAERIYRVVDPKEKSSEIDYRIKQKLAANYPDIEEACNFMRLVTKVTILTNQKCYEVDNLISTDNSFFKMFTIPFISGNANYAFADLNSAVLTKSIAQKLFGNQNPIGKELKLWNTFPLTITGVVNDFRDNSSFKADILVNSANPRFRFTFSCDNSKDSSSYRYPMTTFIMLKKGCAASILSEKINRNTDVMAPYLKYSSLQPLKNMYLDMQIAGSGIKKGNPSLMKLLSLISAIILALSVINYVNLTIAQQSRRNKETGIRKTIGAARSSLFFQYLSESLLTVLISFIIALLLLQICLPLFSGIVDTKLSVSLFFRFPAIIILPLAVIFTGIISGLWPAISLSAITPVEAINKSYFRGKKRALGKNILIIFQFSVSIVLIFCLLVIEKQIDYSKHKDVGFSKEQLLKIDLLSSLETSGQQFLDRLRQCPYIENIALTMGGPGNIYMSMGSGVKGNSKIFNVIGADTSFMETFKANLKKGRALMPGDMGNVCYINQAALDYYGWNDIKGKKFNNGKTGGYDIIGVINNFPGASPRAAAEPMAVLFSENYSFTDINIRVKKGMTGPAIDYIGRLWKEYFKFEIINYKFYDEWYDSIFKKDERFASAISVFAFLAICISCMGILGLAAYTAERRTKEIGIRKVSGASVGQIMFLLNKDYFKWLAVSYVIACPVAFYLMRQWLNEFAYRTDIGWFVFVLSGVISFAVALLSASGLTWRASVKNPADSLRYE